MSMVTSESTENNSSASQHDQNKKKNLKSSHASPNSHHHQSNTSPPSKQVRLDEKATMHRSTESIYSDEDEDLKAALALSLQVDPNTTSTASATFTENAVNEIFTDTTITTRDMDMVAFHEVMWDTNSGGTTQEDQSRWISQGIIFSSSNSNTDNKKKNSIMDDKNTEESNNDVDTNESNLKTNSEFKPEIQQKPEQNQPKWGLVQNHGGPCGVLAAIQAEVLKILLFESPNPSLSLPQQTINNLGGDEDCMRNCLALAMARILAQVAMAQTNSSTTTNVISGDPPKITIVLPYFNDDSSHTTPTQTEENKMENDQNQFITSLASTPIQVETSTPTSKLPNDNKQNKEYKELEWCALDPWPWGNAGGISNMKCKCHVLSIQNQQQASLSQTYHKSMEEELAQRAFLFLTDRMHFFNVAGGVLLFVMSLVETRGSELIKSDMDDPQFSHLISQFGHCSQELLNLLLTGQATTNVFDHTVNMSGLIIHGISKRPSIGYLTQLESLRYCTVGTYYKTPSFPVWVIGSQSHFTVLFSHDTNVVKESESESVLEQCRRVFKGIDNAEENGFIQVSSLEKLLNGLDLVGKVGGENGVNMLAASLEVSGAGIILWDDFWRVAGRLLTGASLESVLQGGSSVAVGSENTDSYSTVAFGYKRDAQGDVEMGDGPMEGNRSSAAVGSENVDSYSTVAFGYNRDAQVTSDEEIAKRLAAEYGNEANGMSTVAGSKTDEELARELQAQFDAENSNSKPDDTSTTPLFGEDIPLNDNNTAIIPYVENKNPLNTVVEILKKEPNTTVAPSAAVSQPSVTSISENASTPSTQQNLHTMEFERFGETFTLHHYNGLRGGTLTSFKITKLSAEEAVGASVALSQSGSNNAGSSHKYSQRNRANGDLEDIVRTRWPSCVFNWGENGGGKVGVSLID